MALITWKDSFSVKVKEIDAQHQMLVAMLNELFEAMQQGQGKTKLAEIIDRLTSYAAIHFQTEEKYFDQFGYPETDRHKGEHAAFVEKVAAFQSDFENGKVGLSIDVINFLSDWLQTHIKGSDKAYAGFFAEHGLS